MAMSSDCQEGSKRRDSDRRFESVRQRAIAGDFVTVFRAGRRLARFTYGDRYSIVRIRHGMFKGSGACFFSVVSLVLLDL